ncbi:hypothetical protein [Polaromonas sp.]|uniref:hypothetical protein n=1 Tax=Polaromonas sp. TaxID=1869339 RepID=UPI00180378B5|nr:hypothetical protein [Polaromonas sp.]NMM08401.1 hypothetical protein [Polaromonas sp.]
MTAANGDLLMAREKVKRFDWNALRGKEIMGWRPGSRPLIFLETALRLHGRDPRSGVKLVTNIATPARLGAWLAGQTPLNTGIRFPVRGAISTAPQTMKHMKSVVRRQILA